ncbi:hypothetical protein [Lysinibacillus parviboronicapiens]|uniref:hypothetical protein n=1 Tax=Lysinibacillus parviboronicapiens TaxID=436516 RepID=UPI000D3902CF|nr:hypothetical protein [Lysinibacillus parviboronicapiens]
MFSGGDGSESKPFLIKTAQDLIDVRTKNQENPMHHYKQVANIDLTGVNWLPIGDASMGSPFMGTFDGDGYKISYLTINNDYEHSGFIAIAVNATLVNIMIDNATIANTLYAWIGILAAQTQGCTITNCHVAGTIDATNVDSSSGGLVSSAGAGTIINKCSAHVEIKSALAGGFVCYSYAKIKDCYAIGKIGGVQDEYDPAEKFLYAGTFARHLYDGSVENCYTNVELYDYEDGQKSLYIFAENLGAQITSCYSDITGGAMRQEWSSDKVYTVDSFTRGTDNNLYVNDKMQNKEDYDYWDPAWNSTGPPSWWPGPFYRAKPISGEIWSRYWKQVTSSTHPESRITVEMKKKSTFIDWDFDKVWTIDEGKDYPRFKLNITQIKCKRMPLTNYRR